MKKDNPFLSPRQNASRGNVDPAAAPAEAATGFFPPPPEDKMFNRGCEFVCPLGVFGELVFDSTNLKNQDFLSKCRGLDDAWRIVIKPRQIDSNGAIEAITVLLFLVEEDKALKSMKFVNYEDQHDDAVMLAASILDEMCLRCCEDTVKRESNLQDADQGEFSRFVLTLDSNHDVIKYVLKALMLDNNKDYVEVLQSSLTAKREAVLEQIKKLQHKYESITAAIDKLPGSGKKPGPSD